MKNNKKLVSELNRNFTYREEANALICECLRNGFIEDLHARITDEEMKKLMIETTAKLAIYLKIRDNNPKVYEKFVNFMSMAYTKDWSTDLTKYEIIKDKK